MGLNHQPTHVHYLPKYLYLSVQKHSNGWYDFAVRKWHTTDRHYRMLPSDSLFYYYAVTVYPVYVHLDLYTFRGRQHQPWHEHGCWLSGHFLMVEWALTEEMRGDWAEGCVLEQIRGHCVWLNPQWEGKAALHRFKLTANLLVPNEHVSRQQGDRQCVLETPTIRG